MHIHGWRSSFRFPQRRRRNVATRWHCRPRHRWRSHHRPRNRSCKGSPGLRHWERHGVWKSLAGQVRVQCMHAASPQDREIGSVGPGLGDLLAVDAGLRARESVQATLKTQQVSGHWSWQQSAPLRLGLWNLLADSGLDSWDWGCWRDSGLGSWQENRLNS